MNRASAFLVCLTVLLVCAPAGVARADDRAVLPGGELQVAPSELNAAVTDQPVRFTVTLDRREPDAALLVTLPAPWVRTPASGIRTTRVPQLGLDGQGRARLAGDARTVALAFQGAAAGTQASFEVIDRGIPAGRYVLPLTWRRADGTTVGAGSVAVTFRAPRRENARAEAVANPLAPFRDQNVSNDTVEESESYVAADPVDPKRVLAGVNRTGQNPGLSAWITNDGGTTWTARALPQAVTTRAGQSNDQICCDPMAAADSNGNLWFGGLAASEPVVARVAPGQTTYSQPAGAGGPGVVGLDPIPGHTRADKPMMTIDDGGSSPHRGRLYVVWDASDDANGSISVYVAFCDTWLNGSPAEARCDDPANWSAPATVTKQPGSYIFASVAAGADGTAYITWWDYSSNNAIVGASCPAASDCSAAGSWTGPQTVTLLDSTGGPVPFNCPIVAQPGGRASPAPQVFADRASGRIYVAWGDLRPGSGSTRCSVTSDGSGATPTTAELSFDAFLASKQGGLPGSSAPSASNGTQLLTDAEGSSGSDDWFPAVAVDTSTGIAYVDFYSTVGDSTRRTTSFKVRSVGTDGTLGTLTTVSSTRSDYSSATCCVFGNDYGDYTGIDASKGVIWPVWSQKTAGSNGELFAAGGSSIPAPGGAGKGGAGTTPASAPVPAPPAPADKSRPQVRFGHLTSLRVGRDRLVRIPLSAPSEKVSAALELRTDGRVPIEGGRRAQLRLGRATFVTQAGLRRTVRVRLTRRDVDRLRRLGRVRAALTLTYVDAAGNRASRTTRFTLLAL
ncbi:MAG: hypothetical protein JWO74_496 [Solirubrobacterales bacterium]|nr:hypothetical protein [Solirubrobacterales bacterium]